MSRVPSVFQSSIELIAMAQAVGRVVSVSGSTSNLGPGFDALGLALRIYLRVRIDAVHDDGRGELRFHFAGGAPEGENAIARAIHELAGRRGLTLPSLDLHVENEIPIKAGLGSSAAAIVAGLRVVQALDDRIDDGELLAVATSLEGHPDNVSASLLGGLTTSIQSDEGVVSACAIWPDEIAIIVATPDLGLSTRAARAVLPERVTRADAVFNVQRVALFMQALATRDFALIREALQDRLHQPYRAPLVPGLDAALAFEAPALLGAFLSGAGPSIAALALGSSDDLEDRFTRLYQRLGLRCTVRRLAAHQPAAARTVRSQPIAIELAPHPHLG
jgi:homoserine kinase